MKALLPMLLLLASCSRATPCDKPEEVVTAFVTSMRIGDTPMAFKLISGSDRRVLTERAASISTKALATEPHELLVPGLVTVSGELSETSVKPVAVEVGDVTEVELKLSDGRTVRQPVVREAGCYRIPLGLH